MFTFDYFAADAVPTRYAMTSFGLVRSTATERWELLGFPAGIDRYTLIRLMPSGRLLAATRGGVLLSEDGGCLWTASGGDGAGLKVSDIAVVNGQPSTVWALAHDCAPSPPASGLPGQCAAHLLLFSSDEGGTFVTKKVFPGSSDYGALLVPSNDNTVVYAFGETTLGGVEHRTDVSYTLDNGTTWLEHSFETIPDMHTRPLAISPGDVRTLFLVRLPGDYRNPDHVVRWHPGGTTLEPLVTTDPGEKVTAATFSADPSKLYLGAYNPNTLSSSLYISRDFGVTIAERIQGGPQYGCLVFHGGELHACDRAADAFEVGGSPDEGQNWFPEFRLANLHVATCALQACASAISWCAADAGADPSLEGCGYCYADGGPERSSEGCGLPYYGASADAGDAGDAADAADAGDAADAADDSGVARAGCGCKIYEPSSGAPRWLLIAVTLMALLRSRVRRHTIAARPPADQLR